MGTNPYQQVQTATNQLINEHSFQNWQQFTKE